MIAGALVAPLAPEGDDSTGGATELVVAFPIAMNDSSRPAVGTTVVSATVVLAEEIGLVVAKQRTVTAFQER